MGIDIRECSSADTQAVFRVIKECAAWLLNRGMDHWTDYYTEELVAKKLQETNIYGLGEGSDLIGVVSLSEHPPSYYDQSDLLHFKDHTAPATYMSMLAIRPEFQGTGLASELMRYAEQKVRASGVRYMRLDVIREYEELNVFYAKRGYGYTHWRFDGDDNSSFYEKEL
jgi:ribosomal protein S18 acetylase RimI-like enzyme